MPSVRVLKVCKQCREEKAINGGQICDACRQRNHRVNNKYKLTKPHRCLECGAKITIKHCLRCDLERK